MSLTGCSHGPDYITGGPAKCPDCVDERKARDLATEHAKKLAAPLVEAMKESEKRTWAEAFEKGRAQGQKEGREEQRRDDLAAVEAVRNRLLDVGVTQACNEIEARVNKL